MKTIFTLIILAFSVCSFGQTKSAYAKKFKDADKAFDQAAKNALEKTNPGVTVDSQAMMDAIVSSDTMTIRLQPYQKQILSKLDSVQKAFAADVEKNKYAIETFNALMQRSNAIQERSKDAQDLIFGDHGIDPKKYRISGGDLIKGTLKIERIKELTFPNGASINK